MYKKQTCMPRFFVLIILSIFYSCKPHQQPAETKEAVIFHPFGLDSLNKKEEVFDEKKILDSISSVKLSVNGYELGDILSENQLILKFGEPDSVKAFKNEMNKNESVFVFHYKKSQITIEDLKFEDFEISDKIFYLDKLDIHIGDSREKIGRMFPKSFDALKPESISVGIYENSQEIIFTFEDGLLSNIFITRPDDC